MFVNCLQLVVQLWARMALTGEQVEHRERRGRWPGHQQRSKCRGLGLEPKKNQETRRGCGKSRTASGRREGVVNVRVALRVRREEAGEVTCAQYSGSPGSLTGEHFIGPFEILDTPGLGPPGPPASPL